MKIRTSFVTNSSSTSSAEIKIDNPVLLEILKKYSDLGAFRSPDCYDGDAPSSDYFVDSRDLEDEEDEDDEDDEEDEEDEEDENDNNSNQIFYYYQDHDCDVFNMDGSDYVPRRIEDVAELICRIISDPVSVASIDAILEIKARSKEINDSYVEIEWSVVCSNHGECAPEDGSGECAYWEFSYNNGKSRYNSERFPI